MVNKEVNDSSKYIRYILEFIYSDIQELIENVLNDSISDPHYSAVAANNLMVCYLRISDHSNTKYDSVRNFIIELGFSEAEYEIFEKKRCDESAYYIGEQFRYE